MNPYNSFRKSLARPTRRDWLQFSAVGLVGSSMSGWMRVLADEAATRPERKRACILLWMNGGPSQMDTFDLKPNTPNGGTSRETATNVSGIRFSEHLPKLAMHADQLAIIRSMTSKEGDHGQATYYNHSGYAPRGPVRYPTFGSLVAKELGQTDAELPNFVSIGAFRGLSPAAYAPGFLGSKYAPLLVGDGQASSDESTKLKVEDLRPPDGPSSERLEKRLDLLGRLNNRFAQKFDDPPAASYRTAYERAVRLMQSKAAGAFDLDGEPDQVRDAYGRNRFGQGCLLARRLVERGVPFVEVTLGGVEGQSLGWDTHTDNFTQVRKLSEVLDPAWSTLMTELKDRGLLESTTIIWMGEFGRTPKINTAGGRDHFPQAWSAVLAGGGIRGGRVVGQTTDDGSAIKDRPITVPDLLATICTVIGIDPMAQNDSNVGRPIRLVDPDAKIIREVTG